MAEIVLPRRASVAARNWRWKLQIQTQKAPVDLQSAARQPCLSRFCKSRLRPLPF
jgi:hypothetical protein